MTETYDVACYPCDALFCTTKILKLEEEEAFYSISRFGGICKEEKHAPYGEITNVEVLTGVFASVKTSLQEQPWTPGNGCDEPLARRIAEDLKSRIRSRGDEGQLKTAEANAELLQQMKKQMDRIEEKLDQVQRNGPPRVQMT